GGARRARPRPGGAPCWWPGAASPSGHGSSGWSRSTLSAPPSRWRAGAEPGGSGISSRRRTLRWSSAPEPSTRGGKRDRPAVGGADDRVRPQWRRMLRYVPPWLSDLLLTLGVLAVSVGNALHHTHPGLVVPLALPASPLLLVP